MEIKKGLAVIAIICFSTSWSQISFKADSGFVPQKGMLRAGGAFEMGFQTQNTQNAYVAANLEFLPLNYMGIRGDIRVYLGANGDRPRWKMNHQILAGTSFLFGNKTGLTPVGFIQPGVSISQSSEYFSLNGLEQKYEVTVSPVFSFGGGLHYYAPRVFHAFLECRYTIGQHAVRSGTTYLDELSVSFGLGFQVFTKFKKKEKK